MSMLKGILKGGSSDSDDLNATVRKMRLHFAAWLRQRLERLAQGEGADAPTAAPSDLEGGLEGAEDIWG